MWFFLANRVKRTNSMTVYRSLSYTATQKGFASSNSLHRWYFPHLVHNQTWIVPGKQVVQYHDLSFSTMTWCCVTPAKCMYTEQLHAIPRDIDTQNYPIPPLHLYLLRLLSWNGKFPNVNTQSHFVLKYRIVYLFLFWMLIHCWCL